MEEIQIKPSFQTKIIRSIQSFLWGLFGLIIILLAFSPNITEKLIYRIGFVIVGLVLLLIPLNTIETWTAYIKFREDAIIFKVKKQEIIFDLNSFQSGSLQGLKLVYNIRGKMKFKSKIDFDRDGKVLESIAILSQSEAFYHKVRPYSFDQRAQINSYVVGFARKFNIPLQGVKKH